MWVTRSAALVLLLAPAVLLADETLVPDSITSNNSFSCVVTDLDEDPDSPDGLWCTTSCNTEKTVRTSFPTPADTPTTGVDLQEMRAVWRKNDCGGSQEAIMDTWVYDGSTVDSSATGNCTNTTSEILTNLWDASILVNADGSTVEAELHQARGGGSPATRNVCEVGAVEWNVVSGGATRDHRGNNPQLMVQVLRPSIEVTDPSGLVMSHTEGQSSQLVPFDVWKRSAFGGWQDRLKAWMFGEDDPRSPTLPKEIRLWPR